MGGNGFAASLAKLPGILMALVRRDRLCARHGAGQETAAQPAAAASSAAWQIGLGCLPVAMVGLAVRERRIWLRLSELGWMLLAYSTVIQFCVAYVCWFAALARLPASVAAIGTMAVPVIGVVASAVALHEPLGIGQIAALVFTLAGVALATRS